MIIKQTIEVPENRWNILDVPPEIPVGATAQFELSWTPPSGEPTANLDAVLDKIWELCKDASISVNSFLEMRRQDRELEEKNTGNSFRDPEMAIDVYIGCLCPCCPF